MNTAETVQEKAIRLAAEAASMVLVGKLTEIPYLEPVMVEAIQDIISADRVIITIEASERIQGLRLSIIPASNTETLQ